MKHIYLIVFLLIVASSLAIGQTKSRRSAKPADRSSMVGCHGLPWEAKPSQWDIGQVLPADIKREELIKVLRPEAGMSAGSNRTEEVVGIGVKPWKYSSNAQIAVLETDVREKNPSGGSSSLYRNLSIAVIKLIPDSSAFTIIAKTKEPIRMINGYQFNNYDLAPYKLSETEYGFGLRRCVINVGTGAIDSFESLDLFRLSGSEVKRVLSTPVYYEVIVHRGRGKGEKETATISVSAVKTNGYFDLIKRAGSLKPAVFKWDGKSYQTEAKDPFQSFSEPDPLGTWVDRKRRRSNR
jgi:hypothetical protein